jgi:hypothetical protein
MKREAGVVVVVERTEALVARDLHPEPPGDPLDGEVAERLKFTPVH